MNKQELINSAINFTNTAAGNRVSKEIALSEELAGMKMYEEPILAVAAANDEIFSFMKKPDVIGEHFMLPEEWLTNAKSVISFFLPFTKRVTESNAENMSWPSNEWLHARIEGQEFLGELCRFLQSKIMNAGYQATVPSWDERFFKIEEQEQGRFTSNWSERHIAFACGLGTFGLSKGLITKKGVAGRFGSIVCDFEFEPDKRDYTEPFEYCTMCGVCVKNCPSKAISLETGKDLKICSAFLGVIKKKYHPRYGCGKCQVKVPCEYCLP